MKCPECNRQHKYKSGGLKCGCGYQFFFSPKDTNNHGLRYGKLLAANKTASKNGTAVFTRNQLYSAYARNCKSAKGGLVAAGIIVGAFGLYLTIVGVPPGFIPLLIGVFLILAGLFRSTAVPTLQQFHVCVQRWIGAGRNVDGLIEQPSLHQPPEDWQESDIYDYGVERILIVQHDILVDLMVKNNQHADQRMLVLSETGYPEYLRDHANRLLAERDDLPVYLLHDADSAGVAMAQRVRSLGWLQLGQNPVVDLGFFPDDFSKLKRTKNFRHDGLAGELPADAILLGSLALGLEHCFLSNSTFGEQLLREKQNASQSTSSFG